MRGSGLTMILSLSGLNIVVLSEFEYFARNAFALGRVFAELAAPLAFVFGYKLRITPTLPNSVNINEVNA
jgi:hypothetical protein